MSGRTMVSSFTELAFALIRAPFLSTQDFAKGYLEILNLRAGKLFGSRNHGLAPVFSGCGISKDFDLVFLGADNPIFVDGIAIGFHPLQVIGCMR